VRNGQGCGREGGMERMEMNEIEGENAHDLVIDGMWVCEGKTFISDFTCVLFFPISRARNQCRCLFS
jgi:hypothetical protein